MIRVLLVDDQKMVRETLRISLETETDIEIVGTANNGIAAIEQVEVLQPDIVIMNMEMPGLDGASATKQITSRFAETKVLIHTSYDRDEYITKSLAMGAKGYLLKNVETQDLAGAIRSVNKGYTQIAPGLLDRLLISTDSGVVISRLESSMTSYSSGLPTLSRNVESQKSISKLKSACRQQQDEINRLRQSINNNRAELPSIKQSISSYKRYFGVLSLLWLLSVPFLGWSLLKLYDRTGDLQLTTDDLREETDNLRSGILPKERVGLDGEFSLNGIAERVAKAFQQDSELRNVSGVYVAQEDDAIVLFGSIDNPVLLRRMENVAKQIEGVNKVYSSQVAVKSNFTENILGSGQ